MKFFNKKLFLAVSLSLFLAVGFFVLVSSVQAATTTLDLGLKEISNSGLPTTDIRTIVVNIIKVALGLLGIVALGLILYAGFEWMTAAGNEEQIGTAKKIMINAVIGLAIILSAYAIVNFVMNKLIEATTGTTSQQGVGGGNGNGGFGSSFYVVKLPVGGQMCIMNVALAVVFNRPVDSSSLNGAVVVIDERSSSTVAGAWELGSGQNNVAVFKAQGACPNGNNNECLSPKTDYILRFKDVTAIKAGDDSIVTLQCSLGATCKDVAFTTGDSVDNLPPVIKINTPIEGANLEQGTTVPVEIEYTDDNGVQNISVRADGKLLGSSDVAGCKKTGTTTVIWNTTEFGLGGHKLQAFGLDWAANSSYDLKNVNLSPQHCFDNTKNGDETKSDCGGSCPACSGNSCSDNVDCASGYCEIIPQSIQGVCVDKMYITGFSPANAAVGDLVSIFGKYFGTFKGHVYFTGPHNSLISAPVADCGVKFNNWVNNQIIVSVPNDAVDGPITVVTASTTGDGIVIKSFSDSTNDTFGSLIADFVLSDESHPGICGLDKNNGAVGSTVVVYGNNFYQYDLLKSAVKFDNNKAKITNWSEIPPATAKVIVPPSLVNGEFAVTLENNSLVSNAVKFTVSGVNSEAPEIFSVSPLSVVAGDYLTITGKNFGNQKNFVWFKDPTCDNCEGTSGTFDFPPACQNYVWSDKQIIVKVPWILRPGSKLVQVVNIDGLSSPIVAPQLNVKDGEPGPNICLIDPVSGPVPFVGEKTVHVYGDQLGSINNLYFSKNGANATDLNTLSVAVSNFVSDQELTVQPGADVLTGPIFAWREADGKASNSVLFTAYDCTKNNNTCTDANLQCCTSGSEIGVCKPKGKLCVGQFKSSGYVWLFSTKKILPLPQVVERCDADTEAGEGLPTP